MRRILLVKIIFFSLLGVAQAFPSGNPVHLIVKTAAFAVSGTVTDSKGEPLVGAGVVEKGTTTGPLPILTVNSKSKPRPKSDFGRFIRWLQFTRRSY